MLYSKPPAASVNGRIVNCESERMWKSGRSICLGIEENSWPYWDSKSNPSVALPDFHHRLKSILPAWPELSADHSGVWGIDCLPIPRQIVGLNPSWCLCAALCIGLDWTNGNTKGVLVMFLFLHYRSVFKICQCLRATYLPPNSSTSHSKWGAISWQQKVFDSNFALFVFRFGRAQGHPVGLLELKVVPLEIVRNAGFNSQQQITSFYSFLSRIHFTNSKPI
jgi:hypothetical protein